RGRLPGGELPGRVRPAPGIATPPASGPQGEIGGGTSDRTATSAVEPRGHGGRGSGTVAPPRGDGRGPYQPGQPGHDRAASRSPPPPRIVARTVNVVQGARLVSK